MTDLSKKPENVDTLDGHVEETRKFHHIESDMSKELTKAKVRDTFALLAEHGCGDCHCEECRGYWVNGKEKAIGTIAAALDSHAEPLVRALEEIRNILDAGTQENGGRLAEMAAIRSWVEQALKSKGVL